MTLPNDHIYKRFPPVVSFGKHFTPMNIEASLSDYGINELTYDAPSDSFWQNVTFCIQPPKDAVLGSTAIGDEKKHTVSVYGNACIGMLSGRVGILLDGTDDNIVISSGTALQNISTVDWVLDAYVIRNENKNMSVCHINAGSNNGLHVWVNSSGSLVVDNGVNATTAGSTSIPLLTPALVRVKKLAGVITAYVGTTQVLTHTAQSYGSPTQVHVGKFSALTTYNWNGLIGAVRFTLGADRGMTVLPTLPLPTR